MKTVHKSVLIWYSPKEMFQLVTDVAAYPEFLPWCDRASVLEHSDQGMLAEIGIAFGGIHQRFRTRNQHVLDQQVSMQLVEGPFTDLQGQWQFVALGQQRACRVELTLRYGFEGRLAALISPVFDKIADSMVDAFVARAKQVYGE